MEVTDLVYVCFPCNGNFPFSREAEKREEQSGIFKFL